VGGAESGRIADDGRAGVGVVDLEADGEIASVQAEAECDAVGMQSVADLVVESAPFRSSSIACSTRQRCR
jgi:hypothetical protein